MQPLIHFFRSVGFLAATSCAAVLLAGCPKEEEVKAPPKPAGPPRVSDADLAKHKPNEAGAVMVLMYHRIKADEPNNDLNRQPDSFRNDLQLLRDKGYYPITALELVTNTMEVPAGKTPVVITFDDALPSQFKVVTGSDGKEHIDKNCAVGIMETFHKQNADWPTKATFFVLPKAGRNGDPFGQADYVGLKFDYLQKNGYEVANHTATHSNMRGMDATKVQWELATAFRSIKQVAPQAAMQTLALPYGKLPRRDDVRKFLVSGQSGNVNYQNKGIFLAAWRPVLSPVTKNDKNLTEGGTFAVFDPYRLERVKPDARQANEPGTFEYWVKYFDKYPGARYVSDGNPKVVAVPSATRNLVDEARVKWQGKTLQVYGAGAGSSGGKSSGSLSVEGS